MNTKSVKSFLEMTEIEIVFENEEILVINKPSGIAVQGGKGISHPLDKELPIQLGYPIHLVHRLDMDTAGLLIVAKSAFHAAKWTKLIGGKSVSKEYAAICSGRFKKPSGTIDTTVVQHGEEKRATFWAKKNTNLTAKKSCFQKCILNSTPDECTKYESIFQKRGFPCWATINTEISE